MDDESNAQDLVALQPVRRTVATLISLPATTGSPSCLSMRYCNDADYTYIRANK
jgi:hypothetical protein